MEATIFMLSSLATNFAGIYWHVPFTVVDPQHTFLERLVGSVQVSSTIYTLRHWHPLVFPEAANCPEAAKCESPAQNTSMELSDILKDVMDQYVVRTQNLTVPCPTIVGNSCSDQPPPLATIHHKLFGRAFDIPLDQGSADLYWTVFFTTLVLIGILLVLWKGLTQGSRKHDMESMSGQKSNKSADLPSEKDALNWIRISRFAVALGIKDDISHDCVNIRAKITEIPENLRQFQKILQSGSVGAECKEGDDVESNKKTLAQVFDGNLRFCTEAVKSALEALNQLSRRVDHRINLHEQPLDGHGQGYQNIEDSTEKFSLYQDEFLTEGTLEATTSAVEKRILGIVDDHISALDEEAKKRIDNIESALAKVQQSLSVGVVDKEQLNGIIGGLKADIENLHTSLQSLSHGGDDSQVGVDTIVHEQLQSLEKRVQSLEHAASMTPLDKKQIYQEIDELDQAVLDLKNSYAQIESKLNSTVTETQVKEVLKEIAAQLKQKTEGMENELHRLMKALDEVKNAAVESKNDDPELAKRLEDIERAIDDSTKVVQSFRRELDSHALEHKSLQEAVKGAFKWKKELQDGIDKKIARVTREIMETNDRIHIPVKSMHLLEEHKSMQANVNKSLWRNLDKCMSALGIKYDLNASALVTIHTTNQDPVEKPDSNDEDLVAEYGTHKTRTEVVDEGVPQEEAQAAGSEVQSPKDEAQPTKDEAQTPKREAQIDEQVQKFDKQRRASAQSEAISPKTLQPASKAISDPKQSPVAGSVAFKDEAAKRDKADTAQSRAEYNQEVEKGHGSAALGKQSNETLAQPKTLEGTQSPQTPGSAKGKSSGKHTPSKPRLKPETSTSARHEKSQGAGPASAQSPSKPNTEVASAEMSKSKWAESTPAQVQPKTPTHAGVEGSQLASPASAQPPSKLDASTSGEMSKSKWADSTPAKAQPKTPTHEGVEGSQLASPASAKAPSKLDASTSGEMSKSMWANSTPAKAQPKTPTHAGVEGSQLASPASAQAPSKLDASPSAEMGKSRWADESSTAQRSKSVSLPSERNKKGDLGHTF
ncbi:uncharacterized protein CDV56_108908 [Aspergillus thermomutatus]|uniref:Uncharacterized protein n=1 Tax=Aspergillus thermomutatus TaxID=41047 RepID=A0A397HXZ0_ASPTH|nr:uncharacterized protein CDV56_108908 [Aspergillus thermomutatus]RHZ68141.1 hypothetical protein CDV56_108908 [Aspergillus thermomutatus]